MAKAGSHASNAEVSVDEEWSDTNLGGRRNWSLWKQSIRRPCGSSHSHHATPMSWAIKSKVPRCGKLRCWMCCMNSSRDKRCHKDGSVRVRPVTASVSGGRRTQYRAIGRSLSASSPKRSVWGVRSQHLYSYTAGYLNWCACVSAVWCVYVLICRTLWM